MLRRCIPVTVQISYIKRWSVLQDRWGASWPFVVLAFATYAVVEFLAVLLGDAEFGAVTSWVGSIMRSHSSFIVACSIVITTPLVIWRVLHQAPDAWDLTIRKIIEDVEE